jgi:hypothetical protein
LLDDIAQSEDGSDVEVAEYLTFGIAFGQYGGEFIKISPTNYGILAATNLDQSTHAIADVKRRCRYAMSANTPTEYLQSPYGLLAVSPYDTYLLS